MKEIKCDICNSTENVSTILTGVYACVGHNITESENKSELTSTFSKSVEPLNLCSCCNDYRQANAKIIYLFNLDAGKREYRFLRTDIYLSLCLVSWLPTGRMIKKLEKRNKKLKQTIIWLMVAIIIKAITAALIITLLFIET